jgi:hypothetical protein
MAPVVDALRMKLANAKTQLGYSEMNFRDLKIQENEPAWFADSLSSGLTLVRELELSHGRLVSSKKYVRKIEKEIFEYELKHGSE